MRFICFALSLLLLFSSASSQENYVQAGIHDHIAVDAGLFFPSGDAAQELGLQGSFGFGLHFWKAISENAFGMISVGNVFMPLGSDVQTDSGRMDLSGYTLSLTPLLGGLGYAYEFKGLRPFLMILGGAQFVTLEITKNRPAEELQNQAYFTLGGAAGVSYPVTSWYSVIATARYLYMFEGDLQHFDATMGLSFQL